MMPLKRCRTISEKDTFREFKRRAIDLQKLVRLNGIPVYQIPDAG